MSHNLGKNRPFRWVAAATLAILALLAGFTALKQLSPGHPKPLQTLRVAAPRVTGASLHFIALARGFFVAEGLDVLSIDTVTGKAAIDMAIDGQADIGLVADSPFVIAALLVQPIELLTSMSVASGAIQIITRADGAIQAPTVRSRRRGILSTGASFIPRPPPATIFYGFT
jgi:NitT/TauT family transport system substrate-binding protein